MDFLIKLSVPIKIPQRFIHSSKS